ncbi:MAG: hypothetical protein IJQ67_02500 [Bacilli bacterium]|nr:hypothetical protein [Bacilli bacterium]
MKKHLLLLFGGITLVSIAAGIFSSTSFKRASADTNVLVVDSKDEITLGSFASIYDEELSQELNDVGKDTFLIHHQSESNYRGKEIFTFEDNQYLIVNNVTFTNLNSEEVKFQDKKYQVSDIEGRMAVFKYAPIEWLLSEDEGNGYVNYISKQIILREQYNDAPGNLIYYSGSALCNILNDDFYNVAFNEEERGYLYKKDIGEDVSNYIDLPTKANTKDGELPSDYVVCSGIDLANDYGEYRYWTKTIDEYHPDKIIILDADGYCNPTSETVGVRPVIRVKVQVKGGGGGSTPSTPIFNINFTGNVPLIIVGFVLLAGGIIVLVIFFIKWSKKLKINAKFRNPWWYYLIISICVVVIIVGCNLYCYGTILKLTFPGASSQNRHIYGLYVSGTYLDDDDSSTDWDWADITHGVYALTKDGKVYHYIGNWPVGKEVIREEGEGSYVVKGKEITITFPETWRTFSFEHSPMTYKINYGKYWEISFYLDYDVHFAEQVPPLVTGSGLYNKNQASALSDHNPDGRAYYTARELGY